MTGAEFQEKAHGFASYGENPMYPALGLAEEAGEVCGKIAKFIRKHEGIDPFTTLKEFRHALEEPNDKFVDDMVKELGDVLWMTAELASVIGVSLDEIMARNIDKLEDRRRRGVIVGDGDNR